MTVSAKKTPLFCSASETYDKYADVQHRVGAQLIAKLPQIEATQILDLGCGTGQCTRYLERKFPEAKIVANDISYNMIEYAKQHHRHPNINYMVSDITKTTLIGLEDLVFSNSALQWVSDLDTLFAKWSLQKNKKTVMAFSLFGPRTFYQLQQSLEEVFKKKVELSAATFHTIEQLKAYTTMYFNHVSIEQEHITKRFSTIKELLKSIKYTGTKGGPVPDLCWTPQKLEKLNTWFIKNYGVVQVTYHIFYIIVKD